MHAHVTLTPKQLGIAVAAVSTGGGTGTLLRDLAMKLQHMPEGPTASWSNQIPWVLLVLNFIGVFVATRLLRGLLRHHDPNDLARLLVITGFFGGLTSYSSLYASLAAIWHLSVPGSIAVLGLALGSGVAAAWLGLRRKALLR